jgi:hypothetical protein
MEPRTFRVQRYRRCQHDGPAERVDAFTHSEALAGFLSARTMEYSSHEPNLRNFLQAKVWYGADIRWYYSWPV